MAVPKKKVSHGRKRRRQSHMAIKAPGFSLCPRCNAAKQPHRICLNCGFYKDREILRERELLSSPDRRGRGG